MRCTKCVTREVDSQFQVGKNTGYCLTCAKILKLGLYANMTSDERTELLESDGELKLTEEV